MTLIQRLIQYFKLQVTNIAGVPESFSSEVYKLTLVSGETVYVKIPFNRDKFIRESTILNKLQDVLPVPKVLDMWHGDEQKSGALLLSAIPGIPCNGAVDEQLAFQIGRYHAKLHEVKMPGYGTHTADGYELLEPNDWRLYIQSSFEKWKEPCEELLDPALYEQCVRHFDRVFATLPKPDAPCMVHMDFRPGNILVEGNLVSGVIDFESARGGSSEIDFTKVNRYIWEVYPGTRQAYAEGYESVRHMIDVDQVLPFYQFYDAWSAVMWCHKRGVQQNGAFLAESIATLRHMVKAGE